MKILEPRKLVAGAGAASVFIGGMAGLPTSFIVDLAISLPLAAVTGFGLFNFWPSKVAETKREENELHRLITEASKQAGIDPKLVVEAITIGKSKIDQIRKYAEEIKSPNTQRRIKHICNSSDKIIENFRTDPKVVRVAREWLNSYLDQTIDLVKQYSILSRTGTRNLEAQRKLAQFDKTLDLLEKETDELFDKLLANDIMEFDVNMTVANTMLKQEGMH